MLKRTIALAGSVALLGGTSPLTATAETRRATAISGVQITWADAEHANVKITWSEDSPVANTLSLVTDGGSPREFGVAPLDAANEFIIDSASFGNTANRASKSWVVVSDAANSAVQARSADFDRYLYRPPSVTTSITADNQLRWTVPADTSTDATTPNDPLDLTTKQDRYLPIRRVDPDATQWSSECNVEDLPVTTASSGVVPPIGRPYELSVNPDNEWGAQYGPSAYVVVTTGITINAPTATQYGTTTTITGQVSGRTLLISGSPPTCEEMPAAFQGTTVILQSRTSSTAAWTVVGTTKTDDNARYTAVVTNPGYREYRVVIANTGGSETAVYGNQSASKVVRSTTRVVSAKFISATINYGTQPQAYLWVDPPGNQQAALQFKNSSGVWQGLGYKTLYAGRGILQFPWNRRGTFQFRWWIPAYGSADATYSPVFTLTVK